MRLNDIITKGAVRFGLLGAGRIGRVHAQAIEADPKAVLVAVADSMDDAAQQVSEVCGCETRTPEAIIAATDIDAVLICTPTDTHSDLIELCARAGKAIFCEKPIDLDLARAKSCLRTVEEAGVPLMVGFNRRFDPHFRGVRSAIDAGQIGAVEMIAITSRDPAPPSHDYVRASGGIFRDMTIHDFDMARFLLGEEIETVSASASALVDPVLRELGDYDSASLILTTASGRHCLISNSRRASYGYDQRIEVHGSLGSVAAKNQRPVDIEIATADGYTRAPLYDFFMTRYADAYRAEIGAFVDVIGTGSPPIPSGRDGLMALALAEAAEQSVNERRAVTVTAL